MKSKLNKKKAIEIAMQAGRDACDEAFPAKGLTDPIADLFKGIRFRNRGDSHILIADVRNYCKKLQHDTFIEGEHRVQRAIQELNAERRELTFRCESLEASIRQIKRHQAEEIIDAISSKPGAEMVEAAPRRRY